MTKDALERSELADQETNHGTSELELPERLADALDTLSPSDALRELLSLDSRARIDVLSALSPALAAGLIAQAPNETAVELVGQLKPDRAAEVIALLYSDVQADLIGELDSSKAEVILSELEEESASEIRRLSAYDDDTAGGLMMAEVFRFRETDTVGKVLRDIASADDDFERYRGQHPYVTDDGGHLKGVVSLRGLLTAKRSATLQSIMIGPISVSVDTRLDELEDLFDTHPFLGLPTVDGHGILVGVVARPAVAEAVLERAESQSLKRQGLVGDELRSMPIWLRSRRRLAWLSANIVLNIIAASVISAYEATLAAVIALAVFLPMVSDMSGCSGNQAVAVTMRELSLGLVRPIDAFRVWLKEISVGVINGIALGLLIGLVAWLWKGIPALGLVVGLALALNTMLAVSIGGVVPLLLKRIGQDPAVASGPLLTTITDMAGFFFVLSFATVMMPWLVN